MAHLKIFIPVFFSFFFLSFSCLAQENKVTEQQLLEVENKLNKGKYEDALLALRAFFEHATVVPDEAAYFYGKAIFGLKKYVPAKEAFIKYKKLAGEKGKYALETARLLDSIAAFICPFCTNTGIREVYEPCARCAGKGKFLVGCSLCNGTGKVICTSCNGQGVIKSTGSFGYSFKTCFRCKGKGYIECPSCHGSNEEYKFCQLCNGSGFVKMKIPCIH